MTPYEFHQFVKGKQERDKKTKTLIAWHMANIINTWLPKGKRVSVRKLMGGDNGQSISMDMFDSKEAMQAHIRKMREGQKQWQQSSEPLE